MKETFPIWTNMFIKLIFPNTDDFTSLVGDICLYCRWQNPTQSFSSLNLFILYLHTWLCFIFSLHFRMFIPLLKNVMCILYSLIIEHFMDYSQHCCSLQQRVWLNGQIELYKYRMNSNIVCFGWIVDIYLLCAFAFILNGVFVLRTRPETKLSLSLNVTCWQLLWQTEIHLQAINM